MINSQSIRSLSELLLVQASRFGDRKLYSFLNRSLEITEEISFNSLVRYSSKLAQRIKYESPHIKPVILLVPHGPDFIYSYFACILSGRPPVPLSIPKRSGFYIVKKIAQDCECKLAIVAENAKINGLDEFLQENGLTKIRVDQLWTENDFYDQSSSISGLNSHPNLSCDNPVVIQYSSGSLSSPKGVALSDKNVLDNLARIKEAFAIASSDTSFSWLPFYHDMGLVGHILQPLYSAMHTYFISPVSFITSPSLWLRGIDKFNATISGGPNFAYDLCVRKFSDAYYHDINLSRWRLAYCGSERISPNTIRKFFKLFHRFGFCEDSFYACYGLAESTLFVSGTHGLTTHMNIIENQSYVCVGDSINWKEIVIVNPETFKPVGDEVVGEIWLRSKSVGKEYVGKKAENGNFKGRLGENEGYFRTGDLGFQKFGKLYFAGRLKAQLKIRGIPYIVEDLENTILERLCIEGVLRTVIFATNYYDSESLTVLLELDRGQFLDSGGRYKVHEIVTKLVTRRVGPVITKIYILKPRQLILTTSGKVARLASLKWFNMNAAELDEVTC